MGGPRDVTQHLQEPIQFGKYTLFERIGRGGMADVYKGRIQGPAGFERVFVVKRILPHLSDDPTFIKMFVEEAKLSARLNHPNIVQIFELGSVEGEYFISMEYVRGRTICPRRCAPSGRRWGRRVPDLVAYVGREVCRALGYAHRLTDEHGRPLGMIHRDVSPSNVMLSYEGAVKLLDFGIAKALGETPGDDQERHAEGQVRVHGARADRRRRRRSPHRHLRRRHRAARGADRPPPVQGRERRADHRARAPLRGAAAFAAEPACPPALDAILLRALSRNRDDRFQSAGEMADALDEIVHAAHFTPQHMATILRETFGGGGGGGSVPRLSSLLPTPPSTRKRRRRGKNERAVQPFPLSPFLPSPRGAAERAVGLFLPSRPRPPPPFSAPRCGGGGVCVVFSFLPRLGVVVAKGVGTNGRNPVEGAVAPVAPASVGVPPRVKRASVLIQTDPEGADIFVAGKLESLGATPLWVTLEIDQQNPTRVMLRKSGFRDKAIAIEAERPPTVQLIPIEPPAPAETAEQNPEATAPPPTGDSPTDVTGDARTGMRKRARHQAPARRTKADEGKAGAEQVKAKAEQEPEAPIDSP